ncbi:MAG TPA: hypothetical protein VFO28_09110, partial [Burkholderiaceae bacterium]|nr:hypothetical protein [Burkholderiaceae bacterium]
GPLNAFNAERRRVVSLVIGDELFASDKGFKHRVPLAPDSLLRFLQATLAAVPEDAWIVIDFDIAPRVEDDTPVGDARVALDAWLATHAARLVLLEPAWAVRHAPTFERQLKWARERCGLDESGAPTTSRSAVLAQPTIATRFGLVHDTADPSGMRGPRWDLGRAVADHVGSAGHKRNPICDRLRLPVSQVGVPTAPRAALDLLKKAYLKDELSSRGELQLAPQPMVEWASHGEVVLRHDLLRMSNVEPEAFADLANAPLLKSAKVVVIGGTWHYGMSDRHDTFVDQQDGVAVHAAWIRSWLQPLGHLHKAIDILLDVVVIEALLHPILEFAFVAIRRRAQQHEAGRTASPRSTGPGRHVVWAFVLAAMAAVAVAATAFALILIDGVLRWCLNRMLTVDTTMLALLLWTLVVLYRIASGAVKHSIEHLAQRARVSGIWLTGVLAAAVAVVYAVPALPPGNETTARALAWGLVLTLPLAYVGFSVWRNARAPVEQGPPRARWRRLRRRAFRGWSSNLRAMGYAVATLSHLHRSPWTGANGIFARWADGLGAFLWCGVWVLAIYLLFRSTLWGMLAAHFGA